MKQPTMRSTKGQSASIAMRNTCNGQRGKSMSKPVRGVMPERLVLAKAVAMLCIGGSTVIALPVLAATTVTTYTYDAGNHVTTATDSRSLVTAYSYDGLGLLWGVSSPDTGATTANFDAYGRPSSLTRANGIVTTYGYDALNRPTSISAGGQIHAFAYDNCTNGVGRLCSVSDATGSTAYTYTPEGWLAGRGFSIGGYGYSLGYGYDNMGHLAAVTYPDGDQAVYAYSDGVVSGITFMAGSTPLTAASGVTWQPMNAALASWTSSNGLANTLSYDADGRLTAISTPGVESLGFSYDTADRLIGIDNALDGTMTENLNYDDQSRLTSMLSGGAISSYGYDADGNRITSVEGGISNNASYSTTSNHLVSTTGGSTQSYGYDPLGNITTLGGTTAYQYDAFNRMSSAGGMSYYVNPEGQRLRKSGSLGTAYFAPDASGPLMAESNSGAWIDYLWLGGRLIGREVNGQLEAIGNDQVGRPQVVTNASQAVVWSAANHPFNQSVTLSNSAPLNIGFPGQYYDSESGLWNNGYRDYDPQLGRYVESDPAGLVGGVNTYAYASNNPITLTDSFGLKPGDCYATANIAAANAIADINPTSIKESLEYAGWIYQTSNGWYSYTAPKPGERHHSSPGDRVAGAIGDYHTHGSYDPYYLGEVFSDTDLNTREAGDKNYLGTPSNKVYLDTGFGLQKEIKPAGAHDAVACCPDSNSWINEFINSW